jgi:hypothetical protein
MDGLYRPIGLVSTRPVTATRSDQVDLVDLDRAGGQLRMRAAQDGIVVFEGRPGAFAAFAFDAASFWCDAEGFCDAPTSSCSRKPPDDGVRSDVACREGRGGRASPVPDPKLDIVVRGRQGESVGGRTASLTDALLPPLPTRRSADPRYMDRLGGRD